jgi:predicted amidohydrolase
MRAFFQVMIVVLSTAGATAAESVNLIKNPSFEAAGGRDGVPADWMAASPDTALRPVFQRVAGCARSGKYAACIRSPGNYRFGYLYQDVPVSAGKTYEVVARYRCQGIDNPNRCVLVNLVWGCEGHNDEFVGHWSNTGDWYEGRQKFAHRGGTKLRVMLLLRIEGPGAVFFDDVEVRETTPIARRVAKVASCPVMPSQIKTVERANFLVPFIAKAAAAKCDIICLSEAIGGHDSVLKTAEPIPGPMYKVFAKAARDHKIYVIACFYERDKDYVYNTAVLLDRQGQLVGKYRKTHLHWSEMFLGIRPGTDYPVFDCDFGRIGIEICYDSWFPEVARVLSLKGAEIIFLPNAGFHETLAAAACCEQGIYFVSASSNHRKGNLIGTPDFRKLASGDGDLLMAEVELSEPKLYGYRQWQTCGQPEAFR